jgi:hypothetical protein
MNNGNRYVEEFLIRNSFMELNEKTFSNALSTVVIHEDYYQIIFMNPDYDLGDNVEMFTESLNIFQLVGILTWFGLIDRNYSK